MKEESNIMTGRSSIIFYASFYDAISKFPNSSQLELFRSIIEYGLFGKEPNFEDSSAKPFVEAVWTTIKPQIDANTQRYLNGCRGGCPKGTIKPSMKGNQNAKKQNQNNTKTKPNEKEKEKEKEKLKSSLQLPFQSKEFIDTWEELCSLPKWKKKTASSLQRSLDQLSKYDEMFAIELMGIAIEGQYLRVVYEDTGSKYEKWKKSQLPAITKKAPIISSVEDLIDAKI